MTSHLHLKSLYLEDNELTEIVGSAFDGLDVLNLLFITGNKLKGTLHRDASETIKYIYYTYIYWEFVDINKACIYPGYILLSIDTHPTDTGSE